MADGPLTERQLEILCRLARNMTREQIAEDLEITETGVRSHITKIADKLRAPYGARTADLVALARQQGYDV